MKVLQLLPTLAMGDAIGNDVRALDKVIRGMGYQTGIYAEVIDGRLPEGTAQQVEKMPRLSGEDVILYHVHRFGTELFSGEVPLPETHGIPQHHSAPLLQRL